MPHLGQLATAYERWRSVSSAKRSTTDGPASGADEGVGAARLLTPSEAAAYLNVTERWVRRAVAERRIDFIKVGKLLRFDLADLDAFIAEQRKARYR